MFNKKLKLTQLSLAISLALLAGQAPADYRMRVDQDGIKSEIVNIPPAGIPVVQGNPSIGQTLTADTSTITDDDGLGAFSYQWLRDGAEISGETSDTYVTVEEDAGASIGVAVSWVDGQGTDESLISDAVAISSVQILYTVEPTLDNITKTGGELAVIADTGGDWLQFTRGATAKIAKKNDTVTIYQDKHYRVMFETDNLNYGTNYEQALMIGPTTFRHHRDKEDCIVWGDYWVESSDHKLCSSGLAGRHTWSLEYAPVDADTATFTVYRDGEQFGTPLTITLASSSVGDGSSWHTLLMRSNNERHRVRNVTVEAW